MKLNLMSMQELDDAAHSQDGTPIARELFQKELNRRERQMRQTKGNGFHMPEVSGINRCKADFIS